MAGHAGWSSPIIAEAAANLRTDREPLGSICEKPKLMSFARKFLILLSLALAGIAHAGEAASPVFMECNWDSGSSTTLGEVRTEVWWGYIRNEDNAPVAVVTGGQEWLGALLVGWVAVASRGLFFFRPA